MKPTNYTTAIRLAKKMVNDNVPGAKEHLGRALKAQFEIAMGHATRPPLSQREIPTISFAADSILPPRFFELAAELQQGERGWISATLPPERNAINSEILKILLPLAPPPPISLTFGPSMHKDSVLILGLSPTIDLKYDSQRQTVTVHAGGKPLNNVRACQRLGLIYHLVSFGSQTWAGQVLKGLCEATGETIDIEEDPRIVVFLDDEIWKAPGPTIGQNQFSQITSTLKRNAKQHQWLCLIGALPVGVAPERLLELVSQYGRTHKIVMDSADMWAHGIIAADGTAPFLIKPNMREFADLAKRYFGVTLSSTDSPTDPAVTRLIRRFVDELKIPLVVVSKDDEPFVAASRQETLAVTPPKINLVGGVGCGDALVTGMLDVLTTQTVNQDSSNMSLDLLTRAVKRATAFAAASAEVAGTGYCQNPYRVLQLELATRVERLSAGA